MRREQTGAEENGAAKVPTTSETRLKPVRKFSLQIGELLVEKRCRVDEMINTIKSTNGVKAILQLDGHAFELVTPTNAE